MVTKQRSKSGTGYLYSTCLECTYFNLFGRAVGTVWTVVLLKQAVTYVKVIIIFLFHWYLIIRERATGIHLIAADWVRQQKYKIKISSVPLPGIESLSSRP
jgi:hypothetical protein